MIVGCETKDGLIITHSEDSTCEVCSTQPDAKCEVPKPKRPRHKHIFYDATVSEYRDCMCGTHRCNRPKCEKPALEDGVFCKKHNQPEVFWSVERIQGILAAPLGTSVLENGKTVNNTFIIYRFLLAMYKRQTADEQAQGFTKQDNGIGFSGIDSQFLSSVAARAQQYIKDHPDNRFGLSARQAVTVAKCLRKYVKTQLVRIANESVESVPETSTPPTYQQALTEQYPQGVPLTPVLAYEPHEPVAMTAMLEAKKADNPTAYFDPFDEGEPMSEQAARDFWKKRFESHPYRGKQ
jgi:hypothetical protein